MRCLNKTKCMKYLIKLKSCFIEKSAPYETFIPLQTKASAPATDFVQLQGNVLRHFVETDSKQKVGAGFYLHDRRSFVHYIIRSSNRLSNYRAPR